MNDTFKSYFIYLINFDFINFTPIHYQIDQKDYAAQNRYYCADKGNTKKCILRCEL